MRAADGAFACEGFAVSRASRSIGRTSTTLGFNAWMVWLGSFAVQFGSDVSWWSDPLAIERLLLVFGLCVRVRRPRPAPKHTRFALRTGTRRRRDQRHFFYNQQPRASEGGGVAKIRGSHGVENRVDERVGANKAGRWAMQPFSRPRAVACSQGEGEKRTVSG